MHASLPDICRVYGEANGVEQATEPLMDKSSRELLKANFINIAKQ